MNIEQLLKEISETEIHDPDNIMIHEPISPQAEAWFNRQISPLKSTVNYINTIKQVHDLCDYYSKKYGWN